MSNYYGSKRELTLRASVENDIRRAQKAAKRMPQPKLHVPENQRPEYDEEGQPEIAEARRNIDEISLEIKKTTPDATRIVANALNLAKVTKYIRKKLDIAATSAAKSFGRDVSRATVAFTTWELLHNPLTDLISHVTQWVSVILQH